jgi:hypothetical protein
MRYFQNLPDNVVYRCIIKTFGEKVLPSFNEPDN